MAPDLLRADSPENIYLEASGVSSPITVAITIQDFARNTMLLQDSVTLSEENGFHALKTIQVSNKYTMCCVFVQKYAYVKVFALTERFEIKDIRSLRQFQNLKITILTLVPAFFRPVEPG